MFHLLCGCDYVFDAALEVEGLLGDVIVLAFDDLLEGADGVFDLDVGAGDAGEDFGYVEGLRKEALHLAGAGDGDLVLFGELVDTEDGDDVLKVLVTLEDLLDALSHVVVLLADDARRENARGGGQRIYGGVDAEFRQGTREHGGCVQVGERRGRRGVGQVVGGHVDGLHGGDGALLGGGDALLQLAHLGGEVGLVAYGGGHTTEEGGDLRTGLGEAEDVVDEEQRVRTFFVAEVLGDGEAGEGDAETGPRGLGHLAVDECGLGLGEVIEIDNAGLLELVPEVVAFAGALADAGEDREAAVLTGDVVDELLNDDGLADAGTAEEADFATLQEGLDEVDDLDTGLEHLFLRGLLVERGGLPVDGHVDLGVDGAEFVHGLTEDVEHAAEGLTADGDRDACAGVDGLHAANEAFGRDHGDAAHAAFAEVLLDLDDDVERVGNVEAFADDAEGLEDGGHLRLFELNVNGGAADRNYFSNILCHRSLSFPQLPVGLQSGCAAYNFDNFLGDRCLTYTVHGEREGVDHVSSVVGCSIHCGHAGCMLGSDRFQ